MAIPYQFDARFYDVDPNFPSQKTLNIQALIDHARAGNQQFYIGLMQQGYELPNGLLSYLKNWAQRQGSTAVQMGPGGFVGVNYAEAETLVPTINGELVRPAVPLTTPTAADAPIPTSSGVTITPGTVVAPTEKESTAIQTGSAGTNPNVDDLRTADQWAYLFHSVNPGVNLPSPEEYGFTGDRRFAPVRFAEWWAMLTAAFPAFEAGTYTRPGPTGEPSGTTTTTTTTGGGGTPGGTVGPAGLGAMLRDPVVLAVGAGLLALFWMGRPR